MNDPCCIRTIARSRRRTGFSLVELLMTIAIVAVLATILMASLDRVREVKANAGCVSNLRSVGTAMLGYAEDSQQMLKSFHGGASIDSMWSMKLFLGGYLYSDSAGGTENDILDRQVQHVGDLLRCPTGAIDPTFATGVAAPRKWVWQTYGMGMYDSSIPIVSESVNGKTTGLFQVRLADVEQPSRYILFADSAGVGPHYYQSFRISRDAGAGGIALRHRGRANAYFLDGHIEAIDADAAKRLGVPDHSIHQVN